MCVEVLKQLISGSAERLGAEREGYSCLLTKKVEGSVRNRIYIAEFNLKQPWRHFWSDVINLKTRALTTCYYNKFSLDPAPSSFDRLPSLDILQCLSKHFVSVHRPPFWYLPASAQRSCSTDVRMVGSDLLFVWSSSIGMHAKLKLE